jgi:hypothetical protein
MNQEDLAEFLNGEAKRAKDLMDRLIETNIIGGRIALVGPPEILNAPPMTYTYFDEPNHGPDGRSAPLPYVHPFDDGDVLESALDDDLAVMRERPPEDQLDTVLQMEEHIASCEDCALAYNARVCSHCLERRVCEPVEAPSQRDDDRIEYFVNDAGEIQREPIKWFRTLYLCRQCRNTSRGGTLDLC